MAEEKGTSIRSALRVSLGEFELATIPETDLGSLIERLLSIYENDADPGVHAAASWLLRRWKQDQQVRKIDEGLKEKEAQRHARLAKSPRGWFVNSQGQTMTVINGPVEFLRGSPAAEAKRSSTENQHRVRLNYSFAIATKEVTVADFQRFLKENPKVPRLDIRQFSPDPDCPHVSPDWYDAVKYCNWLSKKDGIPPEQWCYVPDAKLKGRLNPAEKYLQRRGYRLPTEAEWEYACRAGAVTAHYFGETAELLGKYGWFIQNSGDRTRRVGLLKPNDVGLFDMHSNVNEWCNEWYGSYPGGSEKKKMTSIDPTGAAMAAYRVIRGGSWDNAARYCRSAYRVRYEPGNRYVVLGIRVVAVQLSPGGAK